MNRYDSICIVEIIVINGTDGFIFITIINVVTAVIKPTNNLFAVDLVQPSVIVVKLAGVWQIIGREVEKRMRGSLKRKHERLEIENVKRVVQETMVVSQEAKTKELNISSGGRVGFSSYDVVVGDSAVFGIG